MGKRICGYWSPLFGNFLTNFLLLTVNSTLFLHLKFNLISPRIWNWWLLTLLLGSLAFSLALTFFLMTRPWWWWMSFKLTVFSTPQHGTTHCPSSQRFPSIRHGPEPWESTCLLQIPTTPECIWQVTHNSQETTNCQWQS